VQLNVRTVEAPALLLDCRLHASLKGVHVLAEVVEVHHGKAHNLYAKGELAVETGRRVERGLDMPLYRLYTLYHKYLQGEKPMSEVLTLRIPEKSANEVRQIARRERRSVSEVGARMVEEWLRQDQFAYIEFRAFGGERQACIKGRLQVWQVIQVARSYEMDVPQTAAHLQLLPEQVEGAFQYYQAYPEEIDLALAENRVGFERLKQMFPHMERITVSLDGDASAETGA